MHYLYYVHTHRAFITYIVTEVKNGGKNAPRTTSVCIYYSHFAGTRTFPCSLSILIENERLMQHSGADI